MALSLHPIGTTIYHEQVADMEMGNEKNVSFLFFELHKAKKCC